jgi:oligogalacturonide lyase
MLKGEHLASLQNNDYRIEPNPHVSPDNRWIIFTATIHGTPQAYAVEMPK